ncbi:MAG: DEAD/DEAH box helicase [Ruminococcaceae bacterium]|nr:DEAD/DEAH box helicase [Oscillospiraceae bacterium]
MTQADRIFDRFPPFIKEYIFSRSWESLRGVQIAAAHTVFDTDHHLLLTSGTASGKTEAAFFPILADLCENPPKSVGVLYVAPLKSLINDQFGRMEELLLESGIPVTHWHGDVSASHKRRLLESPAGILQITPESLEAMLIRRSNDIVRLFGELRYVVLDEVHTLTGTDRGNQIQCQLSRIARLIGHQPRRIGLSATVGDPQLAAAWLAGDSNTPTDVPRFAAENVRWRLGMEHFFFQNADPEQARDAKAADPEKTAELDAGYEYMYDCVKDKKALVFSNSREETEYLTATFRQIADRRREPDVFLIHHGNLSAALREDAEMKMKDAEKQVVTCATVTMELGIDIGRLERVLQNDAPTSVSSFLQRLGRSGRRGQPPEMMMVFREEDPLPNTPLPQLIPWGLLRAIAIVQLYIEERFIEPPREKKMPMSLLFHQTLSMLAASGERTPRELAERILSLPPFRCVSKEDYRALLVSMLNSAFLHMTEEEGLIVGLAGERLLSSFQFFAVFKDSEDFTVRAGDPEKGTAEEIGTITTPPPVGERFALAGRVWEVEELDIRRKLVYVHPVLGKMEVSWPGDYGEIHTKILERMRKILQEDTVYPYLKPNAAHRLSVARHVARNTGMTEHMLLHLGGSTWCLFPFLGTRSFRTLRRFLTAHARELGISGIAFDGCYYITFHMEGSREDFLYALAPLLAIGIDCESLVGPAEMPIFDKFDPFIPGELLRRAYANDRLRPDEALAFLRRLVGQDQ